MYKLKIKRSDADSITTKYFKTLQEVAEFIKITFDVDSLEEVLKIQKEFNFRFYLTYKRG